MVTREIALANEILRGVVGSTALGTAVEGTDDRDEMGVFIEPREFVMGLVPCEHYIHRDQPEGVRSQAGDLDLTIYSLRKYVRLAVQGNPSVVILLWIPEHMSKTDRGQELIDMREAFISKESGKRFLGYLVAQKMKMKGERANTTNRPELIAKHGYDTKFAMHALRLGFEGIEIMTTGALLLPHHGKELATLRAIRAGEVRETDALKMIEDTEALLRIAVDTCEREVDRDRINRFLVSMHEMHWY